ncbi:hypothetical protein CPLU01_09659 [Colletotrichum plurivorum]|uniref:Uncharacterized protein n=1 Tax=Colletotrichum plurivorum TaxID=2175906 RepID=A0A8H6K8Q7_9PEZI|nr:hypothetical protein CPLU01_09659 [Colletotrichum plurivorum]
MTHLHRYSRTNHPLQALHDISGWPPHRTLPLAYAAARTLLCVTIRRLQPLVQNFHGAFWLGLALCVHAADEKPTTRLAGFEGDACNRCNVSTVSQSTCSSPELLITTTPLLIRDALDIQWAYRLCTELPSAADRLPRERNGTRCPNHFGRPCTGELLTPLQLQDVAVQLEA